jgi:alpha-beta hydrolase superfamily lysophospholipase
MMHLELVTQEPLSASRPTPILFVHGMWHAAWCWEEHFMPYFAQHGYTVHALSLRGHGGSEGRERLRWATVADYMSDVNQIIEQIGQMPILVGHSMGGVIVQKVLESHQAPAAILLASAPHTGLIPTTVRVFLRHPLAVIKANLTLSMLPVVCTPSLAQEILFSAGMPKEQVQDYFSRLQDESYCAYVDLLGLNLPRPKRVKTPLLVLGAADDNVFAQSETERMARAYGTQAEFFPNMAHNMMLEAGWQSVGDRMLAWLDERGW